MTEYLKKSQDNKIYMLFYQGKFYLEKNNDDYKIVDIKKQKSIYLLYRIWKGNQNFIKMEKWKWYFISAFQIS